MIRITQRAQANAAVTLVVEGKIVADWDSFLERVCLDLLRRNQHVDLELSGVQDVDCAGVAALRRLRAADVGLVGCRPLVLELIEQEGVT